MQKFTLNIRTKRQTTFPQALLEKIGVEEGDKLVAIVRDESIVLKPQKRVALDLLKEIQRIVKESGVPESEIQEAVRRDREKEAKKFNGK